MPKPSILVRGGTIATLDPESSVLRRVDVRIDGDRITEIASGLPAGDSTVIDAADAIVAPGLIDSHVHIWQYPWRGVLLRKWGGNYPKKLYRMRPSYTPQDTYDATVGATYAMLNLGITGALDYMHGANSTPAHLDAAVDAHRRAGMRVALGYAPTINGDNPPDVYDAARRERLTDVDRLLADKRVTGSPLLTIALASLNPAMTTIDKVHEEFDFARDRGMTLSIHQNDLGEVAALHRAGLLGDDLSVVHSNPISEPELRWLAEAGTVLAVTPQSETMSGKSMAATRNALRLGVTLSLGVDSAVFAPFNLRVDLRTMFNALTTLDGDEVYRSLRMPVDPALDPGTASFEDILRAGSVGGAAAIGLRGQLGEIAVGQLADLVVIRPDDPELALSDPGAYLLMVSPAAAEVDTVIVGGEVRKQGGVLLGIDRAELVEINHRVRRRLLDVLGGADQ